YGLKPFPAGRPLNLSRPQVVLIHGLDDPGKIWMNLAPTLAKTGFSVWLMNYPDDQPISESAELFHQQLQWLQQQGVSSITIVAHSMGGLVSRDLLSRPEWLTDKNIPQVSQ
ncbi:acetyltransferase, partial [Candidatus Endoriftia persephone str. Guaymas]|nr:acetyltransferase [Candidatus Endoriftia persephone str. Guaymas]